MAESRFRELERWARLRIQAMIDLSRVPEGGTTGQVVTKTATGYDWATPASGSLTDGDKGDITVSGGGAAWAIDAAAVTYAKMQNVSAASKLLGRGDSGAGAPQEITLGTNLSMSGTTLNAAGGGSPALTNFTKDLGVAERSGTFDITGLSGLTADKNVLVMQTGQAIASRGNARDEPEMDLISVTGYVLNTTTIRCYWNAPSVVVGTYAFAYLVGA